MTKQKAASRNWLERHLPEGLVVDAAWLTKHGYSTSLRSQYLAAGWLTQPARRVYTRPRGPLTWQHVVVSLQTLLAHDLVVGGHSALSLQGFEHYLAPSTSTIFLYGPQPPPTWLKDIDAGVTFTYRNDRRLFTTALATTAPHNLDAPPPVQQLKAAGLTAQPWGPWWPIVVSTPERAILEWLDELPKGASFHEIDMVMEGLSILSPAKLQPLLVDCHSVKVKRLFLYFAERHKHAWLKRLDRDAINLGSGKRMLVRGGRYDPKFMITVPDDLDAHR